MPGVTRGGGQAGRARRAGRDEGPAGTVASGTAEGLPGDELLRAHRAMIVARRLDEKMLVLLKQGKSFFHIGASGHEAVQVAVAAALQPGKDWSYPYYRDLAFVLRLGMTAREVLLSFLARAEDPNSGGRQMPAHYGHRGLRIVSQSSPTGTQFLQAVGTALAARREGSDEVVYVSSGEGTTSQGDFHEALNWASREALPVVFCVQDNKYAISVPIEQQLAGGGVYEMVGGYPGLHRARVDGTDFGVSLAAAQAAVERARRGEGPTLIDADVVRLLPHSSSDNQARYRPAGELEADRARDPIPLLEAELVERGICTPAEIEAAREEVWRLVDEAAAEAEAAPFPDASTARDHVYSHARYIPVAGASLEPRGSTGNQVFLIDAINHALTEEMQRDERVVVYGEDVEDKKGGVFTATTGLSTRFGPGRVWNSPLAESSIVGTAIGMAVKGWKPVVEIQFGDYIWTAMMQIRNELTTMRYRSNNHWSCPAVLRVPVGGYIHGALCHSQNIEATFSHFPGLYVAYPSNAADAKGLLKSAIRGDDPCLFLEQKGLYRQIYAASPEPDEDFLLPWGAARVARTGTDLSIVTYGSMVKRALDAAEAMGQRGVSVEVIDLRTMVPLDMETVLAGVRRTGRAIVAHEDTLFCGFGAEVAARIAEEAFDRLDAPVRRFAGADAPIPYNWFLEERILPQTAGLIAACEELAAY
jgi:2-oxoisovalerate dehydrogenase E1 component